MTEPSTPRGSEYAEILARLSRIESATGDKAPAIPLIDPTANVKDALAAAVTRLDDIRDNDRYWQDKLDRAQERAETQVAEANRRAAVAEKDRLDAQRSEDKAAIALALARGEVEAKTLVGQVDTTAKALAASGGRQQGTAAIWAALGVIALIIIGAISVILTNLP